MKILVAECYSASSRRDCTENRREPQTKHRSFAGRTDERPLIAFTSASAASLMAFRRSVVTSKSVPRGTADYNERICGETLRLRSPRLSATYLLIFVLIAFTAAQSTTELHFRTLSIGGVGRKPKFTLHVSTTGQLETVIVNHAAIFFGTGDRRSALITPRRKAF